MVDSYEHNLAGGWPTPPKNDGLRQLGLGLSHIWNVKNMFETTNQ